MANPNWDQRYGETEYAYGKDPNVFFKQWIPKFQPGSILMPGDGEGRNGVYAATLGWEVTSLDLSIEGKRKAMLLARENEVMIDYLVGDLDHLTFDKEHFDAIGLIYAHFPSELKSAFHERLATYLKPGGVVIFEAFSKNHLSFKEVDPGVGGPADINMLFSTDEIAKDFSGFEIIKLDEEEDVLNEGKYHNGRSSVIRFVGRK